MNRESRCEHDSAEQETAVFADRLCPLCLDAKVAELAGLRKATIKLWHEEQTRRQAAETKLEKVLGLVPGWKGEDFGLSDYIRGEINGRNECAEELEALLKEQTK